MSLSGRLVITGWARETHSESLASVIFLFRFLFFGVDLLCALLLCHPLRVSFFSARSHDQWIIPCVLAPAAFEAIVVCRREATYSQVKSSFRQSPRRVPSLGPRARLDMLLATPALAARPGTAPHGVVAPATADTHARSAKARQPRASWSIVSSDAEQALGHAAW